MSRYMCSPWPPRSGPGDRLRVTPGPLDFRENGPPDADHPRRSSKRWHGRTIVLSAATVLAAMARMLIFPTCYLRPAAIAVVAAMSAAEVALTALITVPEPARPTVGVRPKGAPRHPLARSGAGPQRPSHVGQCRHCPGHRTPTCTGQSLLHTITSPDEWGAVERLRGPRGGEIRDNHVDNADAVTVTAPRGGKPLEPPPVRSPDRSVGAGVGWIRRRSSTFHT